MALGDLAPRQLVDFQPGEVKVLRFKGVELLDLGLQSRVVLRGPVDLMAYGPYEQEGVNPRTGRPFTRLGISLKVSEENGVAVDKEWNLISHIFIAQLRPDLRDGSYLTRPYPIQAVGDGAERRYALVP